MSTEKNGRNDSHRFFRQLLAIVLLVALPVVMIFYNGSSALEGILWVKELPALLPEVKESVATPTPAAIDSIEFGVYDPEGHFTADSIFQLEQIYLSWIQYQPEALLDRCRQLENNKRTPLLTVEPWPYTERSEHLLADILDGRYDSVLSALCNVLNDYGNPVFISWGHEMDQDLTSRYPWSATEPGRFVAAYRYVVESVNGAVEQEIDWIWAPVVKKGCTQYWPGDGYADYIGMPIYSFPEWDNSYYGYIRDFSTTFNEKFNLIQSLGKPIIITEMGVTGSPDFQSFWMRDAFLSMQEIPELHAVIFFYAADTPGAWGEGISTPDWRSNKAIIRALVEWIQNP